MSDLKSRVESRKEQPTPSPAPATMGQVREIIGSAELIAEDAIESSMPTERVIVAIGRLCDVCRMLADRVEELERKGR